jgi:predicted transposase/invertase (TIGR01784 family)
MAHLKTKETKKDLQSRKEWKFRLTRMLYERDYERQDIMNLFRFLDWILELPEGLKQEFKSDLKRYEQEKQMPYITSIERMGIEEGRKEGRDEEKKAIALNLLKQGISVEMIAQATGLTVIQLQEMQAQVN